MSFDAATLLGTLRELESVAAPPRRFVVALSGGLDSTVLTHALAQLAGEYRRPILAVHVDHGLQRDAGAWSEHCRSFAEALGIDFLSRSVMVDLDSGQGLEAAARDARYASLRALLEPGDWLLSAHHEDDQAETVLLNLMRSSGPAGLAGISRCRRFAVGWLIRPLLDVPRRELEAYADRFDLDFVVDPSNLDQAQDRNYLRHEVLPRFELRWPDAARRIRRSASLAREAAELLANLAEVDRRMVGGQPDRLELEAFRTLSPVRQRNLLRHVILDLGLPVPGRVQLGKILDEVVDARTDARPLVSWPGGSARRYRDRLYLLPGTDFETDAPETMPVAGEHMPLPGGLGVLVFEPGAALGLSDAVVKTGLELRFRVGGEKIRTEKHGVTKTLKKLLQERGVVPWMRDRLPLVFAGERLVAVADLWLAEDAVASPGTAVRWLNRPAIE